MTRLSLFLVVLIPSLAVAAPPKPVATGLKNPAAVVAASDGRVFASVAGAVMVVKDGKAEPFVAGFDDPKGLVIYQQWLYVVDKGRVRRVDLKTATADVWADEKDFPKKPIALSDIAADETGTLYVTDAGDNSTGGAIFRIPAKFQKGKAPSRGDVTLVADSAKAPFLKSPRGVVVDSLYHLLIVDGTTGELNRLRLSDGVVEKVADGFAGGQGLCFDRHGRLYISSQTGKVWSIPRPGEPAVQMVGDLPSAADVCLDPTNKLMLILDAKSGSILSMPAQPPGWEVNETPLPLATETTFKDLKWTGWDSGEETGKVIPLRPLVLTHAGDGSNRMFVATQQGVIHIIPEATAKQTTVFLDIQPKVLYKDNENEQGLLGLTFHPQYKKNGEFYVFYTDKSKRLENVVSRFRVSKTDPNKADPDSEQELLRVSHKYWNHDGGTICFGPDSYLYIVLGDGGFGNDPDDHGQKVDTLLGKILRIDVNGKGDATPYAIPKDNPFVNVKGAKPEIFALGVRNPWRMSFDRKTGQGWFADVGQNLWEEINLLEKGGNYGWRRRESLHPFWVEGTGVRKEFIDPIWEYHHEVGKSITGGHVYRGKQLPELDGQYLYADYVSGKVWALQYDQAKKRVVSNRPIKDQTLPIMSFGEDEQGEVYLMTYSASGKGISRIVRTNATSQR